MYKPDSVHKNDMHTILLDIEMQMDHLMQSRKLELVLINKKKEPVI